MTLLDVLFRWTTSLGQCYETYFYKPV